MSPVVSVSLGVCSQAADTSGTAQALLREADAQLYIDRSRGGNRACGAELPAP